MRWSLDGYRNLMLNSRSQILLSADLAVMGWTVSKHKKRTGLWSRMESDGFGWN